MTSVSSVEGNIRCGLMDVLHLLAAICKHDRLVCKQCRLVWKQYRLVCKQYRLVCRQCRLVCKQYRVLALVLCKPARVWMWSADASLSHMIRFPKRLQRRTFLARQSGQLVEGMATETMATEANERPSTRTAVELLHACKANTATTEITKTVKYSRSRGKGDWARCASLLRYILPFRHSCSVITNTQIRLSSGLLCGLQPFLQNLLKHRLSRDSQSAEPSCSTSCRALACKAQSSQVLPSLLELACNFSPLAAMLVLCLLSEVINPRTSWLPMLGSLSWFQADSWHVCCCCCCCCCSCCCAFAL